MKPLANASTDPAAAGSRIGERWLRRAEGGREAFGLLFVLLIVVCVLMSTLADHGWPAVLLTAVTSITSLVALTSADARPGLLRGAFWVSALSLLLAIVGAISGTHGWLDVAALLQVLLFAVAIAKVLRRIIESGDVRARAIVGALSVYVALAIIFASIYGTLDRIQGGGFFAGHPSVEHGDFLFFSFTSLTTTGYGNLVPGGQPGEMIAALETVIGPVFLATLVAGLVSLWRPGEALLRRRAERGP